VFSREAFEWEGLGEVPLHVIAPSIDAFSPKNQDLPEDAVAAILRAAGLVEGDAAGAEFRHVDGATGRVERRAERVARAATDRRGPLPAAGLALGSAQGSARA
jgi:hypothetical protein